MSKALESLRRFPPKEDILHGQIADTYFYQKNRKVKAKPSYKKIKVNLVAASSFAAIFFIVAASPHVYNYYLCSLQVKISNSKEINIIDGGRLDKNIIKRFAFRGHAKGSSKFSREYIILNNDRKYSWADLSLDFKFPIDLSGRALSVSSKGTIGGERLNIVLRDADNRSSMLSDIYLVPGWKTNIISLSGIGSDMDISKITHLRLEYGYVGESGKEMDSPINVTIYLKDFHAVREDEI